MLVPSGLRPRELGPRGLGPRILGPKVVGENIWAGSGVGFTAILGELETWTGTAWDTNGKDDCPSKTTDCVLTLVKDGSPTDGDRSVFTLGLSVLV